MADQIKKLPPFTVTCLADDGNANLWLRDADDNLVFVFGECPAYDTGDSIAARYEDDEADLVGYNFKDDGDTITITLQLSKRKKA